MTQLSADGQEGAQEKPLHVRVAEALGCKPTCEYNGWYCYCTERKRDWRGVHSKHEIHSDCCHDQEGLGCDNILARYDTDWSATGPLIQKYGIDAYPVAETPVVWYAWAPLIQLEDGGSIDQPDLEGKGPTPLLAVCELLLKLGEAGKL